MNPGNDFSPHIPAGVPPDYIATQVLDYRSANALTLDDKSQPIRNTAEICQRCDEQAVKVIVRTDIRDNTRRRILLKMVLTAVQLGEAQVAGLSDEEAEAAMVQMEAEHIKSSIIVPGNFGKKIIGG